ncbi:MAG: filamentous hemagglutinin family protein [Gammaproteobacteria bacterium]
MRKTLKFAVATCLASLAFAAAGELPVPCGACQGRQWLHSGAATSAVQGQRLQINQRSQRAILNWESFNIGPKNEVRFRQPSASSAALNRIFQNGPSRILGRLSANGQVYLINQNGIVFDQGAQVNVHSLVASTLDVADDIFNEIGIANAIKEKPAPRAAFEGSGSKGAIKIGRSAKLKAADGGRILLIAPEVENRGRIEAPGGEAILAASRDKVYLAAPEDPNLRGLLIEVGTGGSVNNLGQVVAERGSATLVGLAVNQNGLVRATTTSNLNGTVRLLARDRAVVDVTEPDKPILAAAPTGRLTLGENSRTEVQPELARDDLAPDAQPQPRSRVEAAGNSIHLKEGAQLLAPSGAVTLAASERVFLAKGSRIDVAGAKSTLLPMARNTVEVRLFGHELADSPLQRDGPLRRKTVVVDVRKGTPLANISGALEGIRKPLGERLSTGGTVTLSTEGGDVIAQPGSVIDFSGGQVTYEGGAVNTTKLISQGRIYDISAADPRRIYDGIFGELTRVHRKWGVVRTYSVFGALGLGAFEPGYIEGKDAGSLAITGANLVLDGTLLGGAVHGRWQRQRPDSDVAVAGLARPFDQLALPGRLTVENPRAGSGLRPDISFRAAVKPRLLRFDDPVPADLSLVLPADIFTRSGIGRVSLGSSGLISVPGRVKVELPAGGDLTLSAGLVRVDGTIAIPSGSVSLGTESGAITQPALDLGRGSRIDVRGTWVNDSPLLNSGAPSAPLFIDGGRVTLTSEGDTVLARGSRIDLSGGAHLAAEGSLAPGRGGELSIAAGTRADLPVPGELSLGADLRAYGIVAGGRLSLSAPRLTVGAQNSAATTAEGNTLIPAKLFDAHGFSDFSLRSEVGGLTVAADTVVRVRASNLLLADAAGQRPTGPNLEALSQITLAPRERRSPTTLSLAASNSEVQRQAPVVIERGARIETEAEGAVSLQSETDVVVDGVIKAPAGAIRVSLNAPGLVEGFRSNQAIRLGPHGQLLAKGVARLFPNGAELRQGEVLAGGRVELNANRGYIVTSRGSLMDVSGTATVLDLPAGDLRTAPSKVSGAAGSIVLRAADGVLAAGELRGAAGGPAATGGRLTVVLDTSRQGRAGVTPGLPQFPGGSRDIVVGAPPVDPYYGPGEEIPLSRNGLAFIDPRRVRRGGFDELSLQALPIGSPNDPISSAEIRFEGDVTLATGRRLILDAPILSSTGGKIALSAPYVAMGPSDPRFRLEPAAASGNGQLSVRAQHIDLVGALTLQGFGDSGRTPPIRLRSAGDLRLVGVRVRNETSQFLPGSLTTAAGLQLAAAQIYPATLTDFKMSVPGARGRIGIQASSGLPPAPLSAGGRVSLTAAKIVQGGILRAPFGELELNAGKSLRLAPGSLTSTSGSGVILPFGQTRFGTDWVYRLDGPDGALGRIFNGSPEKRILLNAPAVAVERGAVVDVSAGGDLLAYEFIPGAGGTRDLLGTDRDSGAFAILPTRNNAFGVSDPLESPGSGILAGDTISVAASEVLPGGTYAMLPARYALLPGALLVTPVAGTQDLRPDQALRGLDGSRVVAGRRSFADSGRGEVRWSGFALENGSQVRKRVEYLESLAGQFFDRRAARLGRTLGELPRDAGGLSITATGSIALAGALRSATAGGAAARIDIASERIAIVAARSARKDRVELVASELNDFAAGSLLVGGSRRRAADGATEIDTVARDVRAEAGARLRTREALLVATDTVTVAAGGRVDAVGKTQAGSSERLRLDGDGALLRVSTAEQVELARTGSTGTAGTLGIDRGATVSAAGSLTFDAAHDFRMAGTVSANKGSLLAAAPRISLGETGGTSGGLVLSNDALGRLGANELTFLSRSTIDVYGGLKLRVAKLTLDGAGIGGYENGDKIASIEAETVQLVNSNGTLFSGSPAGAGQLEIAAKHVSIGGGRFAVRGFDRVALRAGGDITGRGNATLSVAADLTLETPLLTAATGAAFNIDTADASGELIGDVNLEASGTAIPRAQVNALGARLGIRADRIRHASRIEMPSGNVILQAVGSAGDVQLAPGAVVDTSGRAKDFGDLTVASPGGNVTLDSEHGNVLLAAGARLDVSGHAANSDAGTIRVAAAEGSVEFAPGAIVQGRAAAGNQGGSFDLDAGTLGADGFTGLNAALNGGEFSASRALRLRSGDIVVGANDRLRASDLRLTADGGKIDVQGYLDASGTLAGRVVLNARDDLTLHATAVIDAHANGAGEDGGEVVLATSDGALDLAAGARIDVAGRSGGGAIAADTGYVHLRAPRAGDDGVAIRSAASSIAGAARIDAEAVKVFTPETLDSAAITAMRTDTDTFMGHAAAIESALGKDGDPRFHVVPGIEVRSPGGLSLAESWDLIDWRAGDESGVLTLRAAGDLRLDASISDGFREQQFQFFSGHRRDVVQAGPSWSYVLVAGGDLASADPTAVRAGAGDLTLGAGVHLRTGTGNIDAAAGGDVRLSASDSVIYTAGENRGLGWFATHADGLDAERLLRGDFVFNGGDIRVRSRGDLVGSAEPFDGRTDWLPRVAGVQVTTTTLQEEFPVSFPVAWAIAFDDFRGAIGALGGGNVYIAAEGQATNVSVVIPTTGQPRSGVSGDLSIAGGGRLSLQTGGSLEGGVYLVGRGQADIRSGGRFQATLALGDAQATVRARESLTLATIVDPTYTVTPQPFSQGVQAEVFGDKGVNPVSFFTYSAASAADLTAVSGDVVLNNDLGPGSFSPAFPGTLKGRSLGGSIVLPESIPLMPAARGQVELLAEQEVTGGGEILLSDADSRLLRLPNLTSDRSVVGALTGHAATPVHASDALPARIVARRGSIAGLDASTPLRFTLSKPARIAAGRDIRDIFLSVQNVNRTDVTVLEAGRDIIFPTRLGPTGQVARDDNSIRIEGPGQAYLLAGRDVDLGASAGIESLGNIVNTSLPDGGANITIGAGFSPRPANAAFVERYLADAVSYRSRLSEFMRAYPRDSGLSALENFRRLPLTEQRALIFEILFNELQETGTAASEQPSGRQDYSRGYAAIRTLFPGNQRRGELRSFLSRVTTADGGDINILVPGGEVNAGVASSADIDKGASELGIVVQRQGDVRALVRDDFLVNQSRVFALDGGDILIWSSVGDIDAGRGPRTALSIPGVISRVNAEGNLVLEFPPAIGGSGIRAAVTTPGRSPGDVFLFAPRGVVDAGEAGIESAGNLTIVATAVLGTDTIQVAGTSVGVPVQPVNIAAGLTGVSNAASSATRAAGEAPGAALGSDDTANALAGGGVAFIRVEVLGFGDCRLGDAEACR